MRGDLETRPVLAVTGLTMEARIAAGPGVEVVCSGCDPVRLRALLDALAPGRYRAVISFGISGALDPALKPGDVVVATEIKFDSVALPFAPTLAGTLTEHLNRIGRATTAATIVGANAPVIEAATKAVLRQRTGAAAVDTESHLAASFGAAAGLPVGAVRVISDPAYRNLPALAAHAIRPDGRVDLTAVCVRLARNPAQIPQLIQAGLDARKAFATLRRVRGLLEFGRADVR